MILMKNNDKSAIVIGTYPISKNIDCIIICESRPSMGKRGTCASGLWGEKTLAVLFAFGIFVIFFHNSAWEYITWMEVAVEAIIQNILYQIHRSWAGFIHQINISQQRQISIYFTEKHNVKQFPFMYDEKKTRRYSATEAIHCSELVLQIKECPIYQKGGQKLITMFFNAVQFIREREDHRHMRGWAEVPSFLREKWLCCVRKGGIFQDKVPVYGKKHRLRQALQQE